MKSTSPCSCHSTAPDPCETGVLERPRYFPRQLLTPVDLTLEQQYFRDRMRRHNRLLHGWGVVCGALVCLIPEEEVTPRDYQVTERSVKDSDRQAVAAKKPRAWKVRVTPGYVLGPYGDEILIDSERVIDLRTLGVEGQSGGPRDHGEPADPWCAEVFVQRETGPLWLAVRYKELMSRPVRVEPAGCGCEDSQCEYSRLRDGYEIGILTGCPKSHETPAIRGEFGDHFGGPVPACPDCPTDPWVVLARVDMDPDGTINGIDNCSCRRIVASLAQTWWHCEGDSCSIESIEVEGNVRVEPGSNFNLLVRTRLLAVKEPKLSLGKGVDFATVNTDPTDPHCLKAEFSVQPGADPGPRNLAIFDGRQNLIAARASAVTVLPKKRAASPLPPAPAEPGELPGPDAPAGSNKPQRKGKGGDQ